MNLSETQSLLRALRLVLNKMHQKFIKMRTNLIDMKIRSMNINIIVIEKNLG